MVIVMEQDMNKGYRNQIYDSYVRVLAYINCWI